jgi:hypothetical protein
METERQRDIVKPLKKDIRGVSDYRSGDWGSIFGRGNEYFL